MPCSPKQLRLWHPAQPESDFDLEVRLHEVENLIFPVLHTILIIETFRPKEEYGTLVIPNHATQS